jgi:hypothetical protein
MRLVGRIRVPAVDLELLKEEWKWRMQRTQRVSTHVAMPVYACHAPLKADEIAIMACLPQTSITMRAAAAPAGRHGDRHGVKQLSVAC